MRIVALLAAALFAMSAPALADHPSSFTYYTVDNFHFPGSTKLTGINNRRKVTGYGGNPSHAFVAEAPYARFNNVDYPGSIGSAAIALDNTFDQGGFYYPNSVADQTTPRGYLRRHGKYSDLGQPVYGLNEILCGVGGGRNCQGDKNHSHSQLFVVGPRGDTAYLYDTNSDGYTVLGPPGSASATAVGFNGHGDVCGDYNGGIWFLRYQSSKYLTFAYPGASTTTAYGCNWQEQIVGSYVDGNGLTHGFILSDPHAANPQWQSIDFPGSSLTVVASINDHSDLVGWYVNGSGTHGFLAVPIGH